MKRKLETLERNILVVSYAFNLSTTDEKNIHNHLIQYNYDSSISEDEAVIEWQNLADPDVLRDCDSYSIKEKMVCIRDTYHYFSFFTINSDENKIGEICRKVTKNAESQEKKEVDDNDDGDGDGDDTKRTEDEECKKTQDELLSQLN